jgi:pyridoxal/pyridoxine/pyridoxamine kinase
MDLKKTWIQSKQRHGHVGNHARIPNLASIHFD